MKTWQKVFSISAAAAFAMVAFQSTADDAASQRVTFTKDVLPILQANCQICHRPNGANMGGMVAPMAFITYEEVRPWAKSIAKAVTAREMPPWDASPIHDGVFEGQRTMSQEDIDTLVRWTKTGYARGNPADAPTPREFPAIDGWTIGEPDLILSMPEPHWIADDIVDITENFSHKLTEEELPEDRWIQAVEFRPGSPVVHHIILTPFGGIAPGNSASVYRDGYGAKVRKGQNITWNMHYHKESGPGTGDWDQSTVAIKFFPKDYVPKHVLTTTPFGTFGWTIPAGESNFASTAKHTFKKDSMISGYMPHMHLRGVAAKYVAYYPDGREEVLLDVPKYDFNWQTNYRYIEPKVVPAGTRVEFTGWWDNSADNPSNPNPNIDITWGEATDEEMMFGWMSYTVVEEDHTAHQGFRRSGGGGSGSE